MRRSIFYLLFFTVVLSLIFGGITFADQFAFTEDGRKVLLRDDGTWEYVKEQYDFRKVRWGMTKAQVKEIENSKLVDEKDATLTYRTSVDNMACLAIYSFVRDMLTEGRYVFIEKHIDKNRYIDDYDALKKLLQKKYGMPKRDVSVWKNSIYKDNPSDWGFAVSRGDLTYQTKWETPRTLISLNLQGKDYKIHLTIDYKSKMYLENRTSPPRVTRVKLIDWTSRKSPDGEYIYVEGILKNVSDVTVDFVKVKVLSVDEYGKLISIDDAYADPYTLLPGEEATFKVPIRNDPRIKEFKIKLEWII